MQLISSLSKWLAGQSRTRRTRARKPTNRVRPHFDALEGRVVLSTLTVTNNLGFGPGTLRDEIAAAQSGDTIVFAKGIGSTIFTESGSSGGGSQDLEINKNLDIEGPGANKLAITGGFGSRVFEVDAGVQVTLSGLTIENGNGSAGGFEPDPNDRKGGGILNFGTLMVSNCIVTGNNNTSAPPGLDLGGGIFNAGTLTLSHTTVTKNSAGSGGGVYNAGTLTLSGSTVTNNSASYGGGIYNDTTGILMVLNSSVTHNTASVAGADLFNLGTWSADSTSKMGTVGP